MPVIKYNRDVKKDTFYRSNLAFPMLLKDLLENVWCNTCLKMLDLI